MQKHISGDRVAGMSLHSVEWLMSSLLCSWTCLWLHANM